MTDSITFSERDLSPELDELCSQLHSDSEKTQLQAIAGLATAGEVGSDLLMEFLLSRRSYPPTPVEGEAYKALYTANSPKTTAFVQDHFPTGVVPLNSDLAVDYFPVQQELVQENFQTADRLTLQKLCELVGQAAVQRNWLYFSEVERFPVADLQTLDTLWRVHSLGKFGYSVQRQIWLGAGKNWDKFWPKIGWRSGRAWTRYPQEFIWNLEAPSGHLPLSNQLRGRRVIEALFNHPAWK
ncbi:MAG: GUN4 N-terminal ARM-like repeat domain-containing protein [Limnospira sp.]